MNLPALNEQYGGAQGKQYWDERYATEFAQADTRFDWFKNYSDIAHLFDKFIPSKESRILLLGCGNSTLSHDMYDAGYTNIVNVDYSQVCIDQMKAASEGKMEWIVADIRALPFPDDSFDITIDKGTMDALMANADKDVWNPPPEVVLACKEEVDEAIRVLTSTGSFLYITFGQPHFRKPHLKREGWSIETIELGDMFHYYFYALTKDIAAIAN